jgi:hypothetical protein
MLPSASGGTGMNIIATGNPSGYGEVGLVHALRAFVDANIPTNMGTNTNEDRVIVIAAGRVPAASGVVSGSALVPPTF